MYSLVIVSLSLVAFSIIAAGVVMELNPTLTRRGNKVWLGSTLAVNLILFVAGAIAIVVLGSQEAMAAAEAAVPDLIHTQASMGLGMELLAVGIPTGLSVVGAGVAVARIGSASLAIIAEKPEMFGRTLIYLGLAEGLAIYGLVLSILMMGKL